MNIFRTVLILILCFYQPSLAEYGSFDGADEHFEKVKSECREKSQKDWDSGITSEMVSASDRYNHCILAEIRRISDKYFNNDEYKKTFLEKLDIHLNSSYDIYDLVYTGHKACNPCGTMYQTMYVASAGKTVEDILHSMIATIYYYDIKIEGYN